jgi:hypothetical protein
MSYKGAELLCERHYNNLHYESQCPVCSRDKRIATLEAKLVEATNMVDAAQQLCKTYFEIAERHMTEGEIREARDERMNQAADYKARIATLEAALKEVPHLRMTPIGSGDGIIASDVR